MGTVYSIWDLFCLENPQLDPVNDLCMCLFVKNTFGAQFPPQFEKADLHQP